MPNVVIARGGIGLYDLVRSEPLVIGFELNEMTGSPALAAGDYLNRAKIGYVIEGASSGVGFHNGKNLNEVKEQRNNYLPLFCIYFYSANCHAGMKIARG